MVLLQIKKADTNAAVNAFVEKLALVELDA